MMDIDTEPGEAPYAPAIWGTLIVGKGHTILMRLNSAKIPPALATRSPF
jgi:hypothetical protein